MCFVTVLCSLINKIIVEGVHLFKTQKQSGTGHGSRLSTPPPASLATVQYKY